MSSQRQLAKHSRPGFMFQLWSAMLSGHTREAASLFRYRVR